MADPSTYRPAPGEIPVDPGVYRFRDASRRVIYVGKAKSLRPRLSSYFQDIAALHPRTATMVTTAASVEWTVVATEVEALQLEYSWIKEFDPRFNVKYRDDKSYPYLAVTLGEEFPRAQVMRGAKRKGTRYFGPYAHAWAIRETLDLLLRVFPLRTCSSGVFKRAGQVGPPVPARLHRQVLGALRRPGHARGAPGDRRGLLPTSWPATPPGSSSASSSTWRQASEVAGVRAGRPAARRPRALGKALEKSAVVLGDGTDADVFALEDDGLEVAVQVFHVRGGRVRGQRGWVAEMDAETVPEIVGHLLQQVYGGESGDAVPARGARPGAARRGRRRVRRGSARLRGSAVDLRVPQRGDKRTLLETVHRNAKQSLARHKLARAGDLTARSQALQELQTSLDLADAPLRVECYDISHIQGSQVVGSMVVFEDGLARKSEYRRFIIRGEQVDDTAAMDEVLTRRFQRYLEERDQASDVELGPDPEAGGRSASTPTPGSPRSSPTRPTSSWSTVACPRSTPPTSALDALWASTTSRSSASPSGSRRSGCPGQDYPVILPRTSEGLYLLQRVRDEAHRFAITFHRQRRSKAMTAASSTASRGWATTKRKALLRHFGSVKKVRAASAEELQEVSGIGPALAATIAAELVLGRAGRPGGQPDDRRDPRR